MSEQSPSGILVQVNAQLVGAVMPLSGGDDFVSLTPEVAEKLRSCVQYLGDTLHTAVSAMMTKPSEFEMEFGISLGAEAGLPFITKGTAGTNFKVKVKWAADKQDAVPPAEVLPSTGQ